MKRIFEILSMVTLLVWGAMFLYFFFSGRINDLLTENFRPWVLLAGFGLIGLGLFNLVNLDKSTGACSHDHTHGDHTHCDHGHAHAHDHDHDHDHKDCDHEHHHHDHKHDESCDHHHHEHSDQSRWHSHEHDDASASSLAFALAVLLIPLLTAAKFSGEKFSKEYTQKWVEIEHQMQRIRQQQAAEGQKAAAAATANPYTNPGGTAPEGQKADPAWGEFTIEDLKKMVPQTSAGDFLLDVPQIYYTAGDQELMKVMEGISVDTTAQVIEDTIENSPAKRLRAYRLMIDCCAADARPLSIPIDFAESLPEYKEMGWYKLVGRLHFHKSEDSEYTPILQIKSFQPTPEPADWMGF